jgi:hypothetical protein
MQAQGAAPTGPLRLAVAWQQGVGVNQRWLTTYDSPLQADRTSQAITLTLPPAASCAELSNTYEAGFGCSKDAEYEIEARVVMPRIVVYEDVDQSGTLDPDLPYVPGIDRIWGVNETSSYQSSVVAFQSLDQTLSTLPLEAAECIRTYTEDTYSAFFMGEQISDTTVSPLPGDSGLSASISLSPTDYARVVMGCPGVANSLVSYGSTTSATSSTWVDSAVADDPCAQAPGSCTRMAIPALAWSDLDSEPYPGYERTVECFVVGSLDVLLVSEQHLACQDCDCQWNALNSSWVADSSKLPAAWPCGHIIEYCSTPGQSLWAPPSSCNPTTERPESITPPL